MDLVGDRVTKEAVIKFSRALSVLHQAKKNLQCDYTAVYPGKSKKQKRKEDFEAILDSNKKAKIFTRQPGRVGFRGFEKFPANIYHDTKKKGIVDYTQCHISVFRRRKTKHRDYRMNVTAQQLEIEKQIDSQFVYDE